MGEAVFVAGMGMAISMGLIVVGATAAGILLHVLESKAERGDHH